MQLVTLGTTHQGRGVPFYFYLFCRLSLDPKEKEEYENSPFFGVNLGVDNPGDGATIHLNDDVYVIENPSRISGGTKLSKWFFIPITIPISLITLFFMYRSLKKQRLI